MRSRPGLATSWSAATGSQPGTRGPIQKRRRSFRSYLMDSPPPVNSTSITTCSWSYKGSLGLSALFCPPLGSSREPSAQSQHIAAFVQRLRELGWIEGRDVAIDVRWAEGRDERYAQIANEFVRLKVDVILTHNTLPVLATKQATSVIPIV